jgi:Na+-translocating ferredoxin:NAD+ oxidoreductase RnfD subunit
MNVAATAPTSDLFRPLRRFFRTPKGIVLIIFTAIAAIAFTQVPANVALRPLLTATAAAAIVDVAVAKLARNEWVFPSGGILSGMIVGFILSPQEPWIVPIATAVLAITTKHLFRTRLANVFNPAALALVIAAVLFKSGESWWGALPDLGWGGVVIIAAAGYFIADRINKAPLVLVFLGTYLALFTAASFSGNGTQVAEIFRTPDLQMALFFAFFMLDDPPTCPVKYRDQMIFAVLVAAACFLFFEWFGWLYFLPAGLLVGNAYEAARKYTTRRPARRASPAAA